MEEDILLEIFIVIGPMSQTESYFLLKFHCTGKITYPISTEMYYCCITIIVLSNYLLFFKFIR